MAAPAHGAASGLAAAEGLSIGDLPDDLLVLCLAPLDQQDRFQNVSRTSKRFHQACLAPALLRTITLSAPEEVDNSLQRVQALQGLLTAHAERVHKLTIQTPGDSVEVAAALMGCMEACGAAGALVQLSVTGEVPLPSMAWLPQLTRLQQLTLESDTRLQLPQGISLLTALTVATLGADSVHIAADVRLPASLTQLDWMDVQSRRLPNQLSAIRALKGFSLFKARNHEPASLAVLSSLPALHRVELYGVRPLPASLSTVTQLDRLVVQDSHQPVAVLEASLPHLRGLTSLCISTRSAYSGHGAGMIEVPLPRIPPAIAQLAHLQRLLICSRVGEHTNLALPPGPWLHTIKWLGLPWPILRAGVEVLAAAPQLEYLYSVGTPNGDAEAGWREFWDWVARHPRLRCFAFAGHQGERYDDMCTALAWIYHRRPQLLVRQLGHAWEHESEPTFFAELTECDKIPPPGPFGRLFL